VKHEAQPKMGLTRRQLQLLNFIKAYHAEKGYGPTYREMADAMKVKSPNTAFGYFKRLEKRGHVWRLENYHREFLIL
jgi:repressor LexA